VHVERGNPYDLRGVRVPTYNAVRVEDIRTLVSFMEAFAKKHA